VQRGQTTKMAPDPVTGWSRDAVLKAALEETLYQLGKLQVVNWVDRGDTQLKRFGIDRQLLIEAVVAGQARTFTIQFGRISPSGHIYAASTLEDGKPVVFEFPRELYRDVAQYLSLPAEAASNL